MDDLIQCLFIDQLDRCDLDENTTYFSRENVFDYVAAKCGSICLGFNVLSEKNRLLYSYAYISHYKPLTDLP